MSKEKTELTDWRFVEDPPDQSSSDDDFYALCNGYINPEDVLEDQEQIDEIRAAEAILTSFFDCLRERGIRQEM